MNARLRLSGRVTPGRVQLLIVHMAVYTENKWQYFIYYNILIIKLI